MFVELSATSNFTFLTGGSHPQDYIRRAGFMSMPAMAVADENSVAGIVRAHSEAREIGRVVAERQARGGTGSDRPARAAGPAARALARHATVPRLIPAARLVTEEVEITALPRDRAARAGSPGSLRWPAPRAQGHGADPDNGRAGTRGGDGAVAAPPEPLAGWEGRRGG